MGPIQVSQAPGREACRYAACYCEENVYKLCEQLIQDGVAPSHELFACFITNPEHAVALWQQRAGNKEHEGLVVWDYHVILLQVPSAAAAQQPTLMLQPDQQQLRGLAADSQSGRSAGTYQSGCTTNTSSPHTMCMGRHGLANAPEQQSWPGQPLSPQQQQHWPGQCSLPPALVWDLDTSLPFPCSVDVYAAQALKLTTLKGNPNPSLRRFYRLVPAAAFLSHFSSDRSHMTKACSSPDGSSPGGVPKEPVWLAKPPPWPPIGVPSRPHNLPLYLDMGPHNSAPQGRAPTPQALQHAWSERKAKAVLHAGLEQAQGSGVAESGQQTWLLTGGAPTRENGIIEQQGQCLTGAAPGMAEASLGWDWLGQVYDQEQWCAALGVGTHVVVGKKQPGNVLRTPVMAY